MPSAKSSKPYRFSFKPTRIIALGLFAFGLLSFTFYLGLVTGKSMRDPGLPLAASVKTSATAIETADKAAGVESAATLKEREIEFFKLGEKAATGELKTLDLDKLDRLRQTTDSLGKKADKRIAESQKVLEADLKALETEVVVKDVTGQFEGTEESSKSLATVPTTSTAAPTTTRPAPKARPTPPAPPKPPKSLTVAVRTDTYTVQVMSARNRSSANDLVDKLGRSGFEAFINTFVDAKGGKWFRVRVGKYDKQTAEKEARRISKLKYIDNVQISKL